MTLSSQVLLKNPDTKEASVALKAARSEISKE